MKKMVMTILLLVTVASMAIGQERPKWIDVAPANSKDYMFVIGRGNRSSDEVILSDRAKFNALSNISTFVGAKIEGYIKDTMNQPEDRTIRDAYIREIKEKIDFVAADFQIIATYFDRKNSIFYMLAAYPLNGAKKIVMNSTLPSAIKEGAITRLENEIFNTDIRSAHDDLRQQGIL